MQQRTPARVLALLCAVWLSAAAPRLPAQQLPMDLATFPRAELTVAPPKPAAPHHFTVWVADTEARAQQGLMFVSDLPESEGMVFPLAPPRVESMWMKNTYIELDIVFIDTNKRVSKIIERAHPMSLETLSSETPVAAVLELKGGLARKLGVRVGDTVSWTARS